MKRRIIAASLAVIMAASLYACNRNTDGEGTATDAAVATATDAAEATAADAPKSTAAQTTARVTTVPSTTVPSTTGVPTTAAVSTTVKQILTTVKKVTTTKKSVPNTTKKPKTEPEITERRLYDYRTEEETYDVKLKYGVVIRRVALVYYEKLPDGSEVAAKEEIITEYYDRNFYSATYDDLLPAAKENRETYRSKIKEVLRIINGYRADGGLAPLTLNEELTEIACVRAEEIAWSGDHDHTRPNLQSCFSLMRENGFSSGLAGENIGWGYSSATSVCEAWKASETHYENIMNPEFKETGIGIAADPKESGKLCWAQYFYGG